MSKNEHAKHFDWLSIPPDERIIDDETMQWLIEDDLPLDGLEAPVSDELPPKKRRFRSVEVTSESTIPKVLFLTIQKPIHHGPYGCPGEKSIKKIKCLRRYLKMVML